MNIYFLSSAFFWFVIKIYFNYIISAIQKVVNSIVIYVERKYDNHKYVETLLFSRL